MYTVKLHSGVKFQDGTDFNAEAVKANLDRASNPDNHLKRYNLYKNIASTEAVDPTTVKITNKRREGLLQGNFDRSRIDRLGTGDIFI